MTASQQDPRLGTDLGPYRIESVIGRGGMGVVYLATHTRSRPQGRAQAPDARLRRTTRRFRARFLRESKLAASIDHPNIIPVYDAGEIEGTFFLAMRYVEGDRPRARASAMAPWRPARRPAILAQVASALDAAHAAGSSIATSSRPTSSSPRARAPMAPITPT